MSRRRAAPVWALLLGALIATSCSDTPDSSPAVTTSMAIEPAVIEAATGIAALDEVLAVAAAVNQPCASLDQWTADLELATVALIEVASAIERDDELSDWRGSSESAEARDLVMARFVTDHECADTSGDVGAARRAAARAAGAVDGFALGASGRAFPKLASRFWVTTDQLGSSIEAERLLIEFGGIDTLIIGDSATMRAIDPVAVGEATGRVVLNAGTDGLLPSMATPMIEEYERIGVHPATVILGVDVFSTFVPCGDFRPAIQAAAADRRTTAFQGVAVVAELSGERRVHGGENLAYEGPLLDLYTDGRDPAGHGSVVEPKREADLDRQEETYRRTVGAGEVCADHVEEVRRTVEALEDRGTRVVVVFMPIAPRMAAVHPDGMAGLQSVLDLYRDALGLRSSMVIDASELIDEQDFYDLVHANEIGRSRVTDVVIAALLAA